MRTTRTRAVAAVAVSLGLLLAGCQFGGTSATGAGAPSMVNAAGQPPLMQVHDPKQVTYSRALTAGQCHARTAGGQELPDPSCTPGAVDPQVTVAELCRPGGYTGSVRPPVSGTDGTGKAKHYAYAAYGVPAGDVSELDHLVPLAAGGSNDITNLWPELGRQPNPKDHVELVIHDAICAHKVDMSTAQRAIASNWTTALSVLGLTGMSTGSGSGDGD